MNTAPDGLEHARLAYEALGRMGLGSQYSAEAFSHQFVALGRGLPGEYEFAAIAVWGGATLVQQVDSGRWTRERSSRYKVPDLLVAIPGPDGRDRPFWVEVKTSSKERVRITRQYRERMLRFQELPGIPYLIALRHPFGVWLLREVDSLYLNDVAYAMDANDMRDSLMGLLLNEFTFHPYPGLSLTIEAERPSNAHRKGLKS